MTDPPVKVPFLDVRAATQELEAPALEAIERVVRSGWYVLGGYRLGQVLPYVTYASTTKATPYAPVGALSYDQSSQALGVRWDAFKSADLKFQLERVDPRGTPGISFTRTAPDFGGKTVTVMSLALDFVF